MKTTALLLLLPFSLLAQEAFEQLPTLSAAAILEPEFAAGDGFTVRDPVPTYGGRNVYTIDSAAGVFEADGNVMLIRGCARSPPSRRCAKSLAAMNTPRRSARRSPARCSWRRD